MLIHDRKKNNMLLKLLSAKYQIPTSATVPDPAPAATPHFEFKPVKFTREQLTVFEKLQEYFPLILGESEFNLFDDPYNQNTLSKIDPDLVISETFDSAYLIQKVQGIINSFKQQCIASQNWSKCVLQHLEPTFRHMIMTTISNSIETEWSAIAPYDQYKLIFFHLFSSFDFMMYRHEMVNRLVATGIEKHVLLKPAMITFIKQAEQLPDSIYITTFKMFNWSGIAEPMLGVDITNKIAAADTYSALNLAIDMIPDTIIAKSSLCYHQPATTNNARFKCPAPPCACYDH